MTRFFSFINSYIPGPSHFLIKLCDSTKKWKPKLSSLYSSTPSPSTQTYTHPPDVLFRNVSTVSHDSRAALSAVFCFGLSESEGGCSAQWVVSAAKVFYLCCTNVNSLAFVSHICEVFAFTYPIRLITT